MDCHECHTYFFKGLEDFQNEITKKRGLRIKELLSNMFGGFGTLEKTAVFLQRLTELHA
jgi:hypothetical protein